MEDVHKIADIMADVLAETPGIQGVTMEHIKAEAGLPEYKINRAIDDLIEIAKVRFRKDAIMLSNEFIYGYRYESKRLWYEEFEGKPLHDKIQILKTVRQQYDKGEISKESYYYILGRIDQQCFSAGYL